MLLLVSCKEKEEQTTRIVFKIFSAQGRTVFLQKVPFNDELEKNIDSATVLNGEDSIIFFVPTNDERLYEIKIKGFNKYFLFINDAPEVRISGNMISDRYVIDGSPASISLKAFFDNQRAFSNESRKIEMNFDSAKKNGLNKKIIDSLGDILNKRGKSFFKNYIAFADTVQSPAAFMAVYNNVDFGRDYRGWEDFINSAVRRFPGYEPIVTLQKNILDMVSIYEAEYQIGDTLPTITLPDKLGIDFTTASLKGKYYLIDFWSTWCPQCSSYTYYKKEAWEKFQNENFEIVSIALDDDKNNWAKFIDQGKFNWTQLIDEKLWGGVAAKTLKFDSIPFNFLVSPNGHILQKGIKPDSLTYVIGEYLK